MSKLLRYAFRSAGLAALVAGASSTPASAAMFAAVCNTSNCSGANVVVQDNGAGDTIAASGAINFSIAAFGYSLVVNTSQSKPMIGSATAPQLDLTFSATSGGSVMDPIYLFVSDTDFVTSGNFLLSLAETSSGGSGSVTGSAYGGTDNDPLSFLNLIGSIGPLTGSAAAGSASGSFVSAVVPYSLTLGTEISRSTAGTTTGDVNLQVAAVPEPATWAMMLLGFGAVGLGMRRQKKAAALAQAV